MDAVWVFELFSISVHTLTNSVGIMANSLLVLLCLYRTPETFKTYSVLLLNAAVTDFIACCCAIFVQQRVIPTGTSIFFLPSGPCKYVGGRFCIVIHSIATHCYTHSMYGLMVSFVYRYLILKNVQLTNKMLLIALGVLYIPSLLQLIAFIAIDQDPLELAALLHSRFPDYSFESSILTGMRDILDWRCLYVTLHLCLSVYPIYFVIFWCRRRTLNILETKTMALRTKKLHKNLLLALTFQAMLPGVFVFAVITFALGMLRIYHHPFLELSTFVVVGLIPALAPLGTLYFVKPYNHWIRRAVYPGSIFESSTRPGISQISDGKIVSTRTVASPNIPSEEVR